MKYKETSRREEKIVGREGGRGEWKRENCAQRNVIRCGEVRETRNLNKHSVRRHANEKMKDEENENVPGFEYG